MESFISGLAQGVEYASELGVKSVDIGMNHRGRLNVISIIAKK